MNSYTIKVPSDIFYARNVSYMAHLEESVKLVSDNSALIPSFNSDITALAGSVINYDITLQSIIATGFSIGGNPKSAQSSI